LAKLFQPMTSTPVNGGTAGASEGGEQATSNGGRGVKLGKASRVPDIESIDAIVDPVEREAAQKLQQAVQRIKANRERRNSPARGGPGSSASEPRRDW
jgi:hypothetical protein